MPRYKMVVYSKAKEGRDKEYNDWYNKTHIHEITAYKGIKSGQRYNLALNMTQTPGVMSYLAIYDVEVDDLKTIIDQMMKGGTTPCDALDQPSASLSFFEESGPMVYHKSG